MLSKKLTAYNTYLLIGLLLLAISLTIGIGWVTVSRKLITLFTSTESLGPTPVLSILFSGIFFCTKFTGSYSLAIKLKQITSSLVMIISIIIISCISTKYSFCDFVFSQTQLPMQFRPENAYLPNILWLIAGLLLFKSTTTTTNRQLSYLEIINFILLFFAMLGMILSFYKFELIYTWMNQFSMPFAYGLALTLVSLGMIVVWGDIRTRNGSSTGEEDRQIRFFSASMLSQAIMSAFFLGATILAFQNETFLKKSLEHYTDLKSNVINNIINSEITEFQRGLAALNINIRKAKDITFDEDTKQRFRILIKSQNANAIQISGPDKKLLFSYDHLIKGDMNALKVRASIEIHIFKTNKWYIQFTAPIKLNESTHGELILQKPLPIMANIESPNDKSSNSEQSYICSQDNENQPHCLLTALNSAPQKLIANINVYDKNLPIGSVFVDKNAAQTKTLSIIENLQDLGLRFLVMINVESIEKKLIRQMYIASPVIILFIVFFLKMLNWHILPIFRRSINAEKDAVESARMLMESESKIRTIIDNIGESVIVFLETGKIESMNRIALENFKYDQASVRSLELSSLISDKSMDFMTSPSEHWKETLGIQSDGNTFNALIKIKDLTIRKRQLFIAIIRDITEQKISEQKLSQSEKVFRNSFDHAPIGMIVLDMKNTITKVNQALCTMVGYHESELLQNNLKKILPPDLRFENAIPFVKLTELGMKNFIIESPLLTKSGEQIKTVSTMTLFVSQTKENSFFIAQIEDVTVRQRYEQELKEANTELENKFKELKIHTNITEELNTMNGILQACLTIAEALPPIEKFAGRLFQDMPGALYLTSPEFNHLEIALRWGNANNNIDIIQKNDCWALRRSQPYMVVGELADEILCYHYENLTLAGHICIPLIAQGDLIGLITFYSVNENFSAQSASLKRLALSFSDHIALSLSNIRLRERLQEQSISDSLTNLYNRRYFDESIKLEMIKAERKSLPLNLLMIDIDYFKNFNDTYGHDLGDVVLQEVSRTIKKHLRATDIACRIGGEEFAIIMPEASTDIAFNRAEEIRHATNLIKIKSSGRSIEPITISIGLAVYPKHATTIKSLIESADIALYKAKNSGRNQTIISEDF